MVNMQRQLGMYADGAVLEGRDIGTVVFPDASFKYYIDASFEERVSRRFKEFEAKGGQVSRSAVEEDLKTRDATDRSRKYGPLKKADDAVYVDTTEMSIAQVVDKVFRLITREGNSEADVNAL